VVLEDAETGEQIYVETQNRKFRERFRNLVDQRRQQIERTFARNGIDVLALTTEGDMARDLGRFAMLRRQTRQRQATTLTRAAAGMQV
jgi:sortase (surface protein transpeptidase)